METFGVWDEIGGGGTRAVTGEIAGTLRAAIGGGGGTGMLVDSAIGVALKEDAADFSSMESGRLCLGQPFPLPVDLVIEGSTGILDKIGYLQATTGLKYLERRVEFYTADGALMSKNVVDAYNLLEEMTSNNYQLPSKRSSPRKAIGAYEIDALSVTPRTLIWWLLELIGYQLRFQRSPIIPFGQLGKLGLDKGSNNTGWPFLEEMGNFYRCPVYRYSKKLSSFEGFTRHGSRCREKIRRQLRPRLSCPRMLAFLFVRYVEMAITLRSGKEVEGVSEKSIESSKEHVDDDKDCN
ncbi:Uncharacterized protein TCM_024040 [Theobroma cacao]|uniref:Uncharacterized protein n=1 Tax=Theobroma cacao TaxID=3641 RepID=A0A061EWM0_THECC|nr:Uncharacterized protein TCM_024040 [Theobroma cacao]